MLVVQLSARAMNVLLVDAGREFCTTIERAFRQAHPGVGFVIWPSGQEAIEYLARCGPGGPPVPDLLLVNRDLVGGCGPGEVLRAVRALERLARLRVLLTGGSNEPEDGAQARSLGADGYFYKPPTKGEYPLLIAQVQHVLAWSTQKSWPEIGPLATQSRLAVETTTLQCSPGPSIVMSPAHIQPFFDPSENRSFADKFFELLGFMRQDAEERLDPFQLALARVCRRHRLTQAQLMRGGGSQQLVANRREALVDLINEKWPDETILQIVHVSETELKRLKKAAREKVGPKLDHSTT